MSEWVRRERLFVSSEQSDAALNFVGGSPFAGDLAASGVRLPAVPTTAQNKRYLVRCCGLPLQKDERVVIRDLELQLSIGANVEQENGTLKVFEVPVTTPGWRFQDGGVTFHLRKVVDSENDKSTPHDMTWPEYRLLPCRSGLSSVILGSIEHGAYAPLNGGMPYGDGIAGLGTIRDPAYKPNLSGRGIEVLGPCELVVYASVHQTDPLTRVRFDGSIDIRDAVSREEWFTQRFPDASRYWRVGAVMTVDVYVPRDGIRCMPTPKGGDR